MRLLIGTTTLLYPFSNKLLTLIPDKVPAWYGLCTTTCIWPNNLSLLAIMRDSWGLLQRIWFVNAWSVCVVCRLSNSECMLCKVYLLQKWLFCIRGLAIYVFVSELSPGQHTSLLLNEEMHNNCDTEVLCGSCWCWHLSCHSGVDSAGIWNFLCFGPIQCSWSVDAMVLCCAVVELGIVIQVAKCSRQQLTMVITDASV